MRKFIIGWRQVGACLVLLAAGAMIASVYSVVAVPLAKEFQPSRMVLMLAMTIMSMVGGALSPILGSQMDRRSLRGMMFLGAGLLSVGFVALSFATSFTQVLIVYGLFMAPANVLIGPMAASVLISRWFVRRRGAAIGIAITGVALGGFFFPPLIQGLLDFFSWRDAFRLLGLIIGLMTFPAVALVINTPAERGLHPDGVEPDPEAVRALAAQPVLTSRQVLADPTFWCAALVFAVVLSGMKGMVTNLVPLALDEGIKPTVAALLISIYSACGFVAKFSFAVVSDRLNMRTLLFVSLAGFATGAILLTRADMGYAVIATGVGLIGLFGGLMVPTQGLFIPRVYGAGAAGRVGGLMSFVTLCALLSTPPIFGLIFDLTGNYDAIFLSFAVLAVGVMLVVPRIRLPQRPAPTARDGEGTGVALPVAVERP
ncbi:MFS transporter [Sphingobium sufflavum]|uniref:MFS transporter n=1 Tax=Sphingobium sufflavum TaxID=1129547 RepID=UPI001F46CA66|nr:MFS transporter [Sphingobium sufflavum]MCE7796775.1 MFS transporter [Sphingobium sufflavum]